MRYYDLQLFAPIPKAPNPAHPAPANASQPLTIGITQVQYQTSAPPKYEWTSYPGGTPVGTRSGVAGSIGVPDSGAPLIEFDGIAQKEGAPLATGFRITVHGVPLSLLKQATTLYDPDNPWYARLLVGFGPGLPLADASHNGVAVQGTIMQALGNWVGTDMELTIFLSASGNFTLEQPGNFTLLWRKGQSLADALHATLDPIYGASTVRVNVSPSYVAPWDKLHRARTLGQLAAWLRRDTESAVTGPVRVWASKGQVRVADSTYAGTQHAIKWTDMIGQPTWVLQNTLSVQLTMRGDLDIGDVITLPDTLGGRQVISGPGLVERQLPIQQTGFNSSGAPIFGGGAAPVETTFTGAYLIQSLRYIGNSRSSDSTQWAVVVRCVSYTPPSSPPFSGTGVGMASVA